jgi:hypothetical protein
MTRNWEISFKESGEAARKSEKARIFLECMPPPYCSFGEKYFVAAVFRVLLYLAVGCNHFDI